MNILNQIAAAVRSDFAETLGWILVHSSWQILFLAALYWACRTMTQNALVRYWSGVGLMLSLVVSAVVTSVWMNSSPAAEHAVTYHDSSSATAEAVSNLSSRVKPTDTGSNQGKTRIPEAASHPTSGHENNPELPQGATASVSGSEIAHVGPVIRSRGKARLSGWIESALPLVVLCWGIGAVAFATRPFFGTLYTMRVRRRGVSDLPEDVQNLFNHCVEQAGIRRPVRGMQSTLAKIPMVAGYLRPMILMPISVVTDFSPAEVEAIFRHELAHVKRHDVLINMFQSAIETVFFFHPCLWWLTNQIRLERENCCDDLASRNHTEAMALANALYRLEETRLDGAQASTGPSSTAIVAATGGNLQTRIKRLVVKRHAAESKSIAARLPAIIFIGLILVGLSASVWAQRTTKSTPADFGKTRTITLKSVGGSFPWNVLKVDDPKQIQQIEESFAGFRSPTRGADPAGYEIDLQIVLTNDSGDKVILGVSTELGLWNRGNGDFLMSNRLAFLELLNTQAKTASSELPKNRLTQSRVKLKGSTKPVEIQFDEATGSMIFKGDRASVAKLSAMMKRLDEIRSKRQRSSTQDAAHASRDQRLLLADAKLAQAAETAAHSKKLHEKGYITQQQLRSDELKLQQARNELNVIKSELLVAEANKQKNVEMRARQLEHERAIIKAQIAAAEAELAFAVNEYERTSQLFQQKLAPKSQLDRNGVEVEKAKATLTVLKLKLKQLSPTPSTTKDQSRSKSPNEAQDRATDPSRRDQLKADKAKRDQSRQIELQVLAAELDYADAALKISQERYDNIRKGKEQGVNTSQELAEAQLQAKRDEADLRILQLRYQQAKEGVQPKPRSSTAPAGAKSEEVLRIELEHAQQQLDLAHKQMEIFQTQYESGTASQIQLLEAKRAKLKAEMVLRVAENAYQHQVQRRKTIDENRSKRLKSSKAPLRQNQPVESRRPKKTPKPSQDSKVSPQKPASGPSTKLSKESASSNPASSRQ